MNSIKFLVIFALGLSTATAFIDNYPNYHRYKVSIFYNKANPDNRCGGSVIDSQWILTAAHCVSTSDIHMKITGFDGDYYHPFIARAEDIFIHPGINGDPIKPDIALVRFNYLSHIEDAELPTPDVSLNEGTAVGAFIDDFLAKYLEITSNEKCRAYNGTVGPNNLCVKSSDLSGLPPCYIDNGGPLLLGSTNIQIGVQSYPVGNACTGEYPVVFTRLTNFLGWIKETISTNTNNINNVLTNS